MMDSRSTMRFQPNIVFIVAVRNNAALLDKCLESVAQQTYSRTRCLVLDDASDDDTAAVALHWQRMYPQLFDVRTADVQRGKMAALFDCIQSLDDHDIVVELDGDDRLNTLEAAAEFARLHASRDLVWTNHKAELSDGMHWDHWASTDIPAAYRSGPMPRLKWSRSWHPGHLRSFKVWAFRTIRSEDLTFNGEWVHAASDVAYFAPLVEMTPPQCRYFYDREMAIYNVTPSNDHLADDSGIDSWKTQLGVATELFGREPYTKYESKLLLGVLNQGTGDLVRELCSKALSMRPSTWVRLLSTVDAEPWHPRVQLYLPPAPLAKTAELDRRSLTPMAVQWLLNASAQLLGSSEPVQVMPSVPLMEVSL